LAVQVRLFVTCLIDIFRPSTAQAAVRVLERRGATVAAPEEQTCCGQFAYNAGYRDEARAMALHFLDAFSKPGCNAPILALSGSCAAMVRDIYPELVGDDARYPAVRAAVADLSEWLAAHPGPSSPDARDPVPVAFHTGCHMRRMLALTEEPFQVLGQVGVQARELRDADQCCGFGGTYAMAEPEVSTAMADAKLERLQEAQTDGVRALVGSDWGCLLHMAGRLSRLGREAPVLHLADLVDLADSGPITDAVLRGQAVFGNPAGEG
jgi:L-lactate dehydrogenase complex protein LldE